MRKFLVFTASIALFYSCENDLEEIPSVENTTIEDTDSKTLGIDRHYFVKNAPFGLGSTRIGDFNNDGKDDLIELRGTSAILKLSRGAGAVGPLLQNWTIDSRLGGAGFTFAGDFNGDGFADVASANGGTVYMKLNNRQQGFDRADWFVANSWGGSTYTLAGDFTGDGKLDIASASGTRIFMKISTGNGFSSRTWNTDGRYGGGTYTLAGDYNGDGKDDIISLSYGNIFIKESTGTQFISKTHTTINRWGGGDYTWMADTDGDGKDEIITAISNLIIKREWISGTQWSIISVTTRPNWSLPGYNFVMDYTGDGSDEIVSNLVSVGREYLYIH